MLPCPVHQPHRGHRSPPCLSGRGTEGPDYQTDPVRALDELQSTEKIGRALPMIGKTLTKSLIQEFGGFSHPWVLLFSTEIMVSAITS